MAWAYGVSPNTMSSPFENSSGRRPIIVVAGPTASGKSELAIRIAEAFGGTVINADSMQVYQELEILTARPGAADIKRVPHRLFGTEPLAKPCSVAVWREKALEAIAGAWRAGRMPVLCGGTGFYIRALVDGIAPVPEIPDATRAAARAHHASLGGPAFHAALGARDPVMAARLADGDSQRLIRAWEVLEATGRSLASWQAESPAPADRLEAFSIALMPARPVLYAACDSRFLAMVGRGAVEEARRIAALGLDPDLSGMKALGLPLLIQHVRGALSLDAAVELAQRETRRYAKRQTTWFRHQLKPDCVISAQYSKSVEPRIFPKIRQYLLTDSL